MHDFENVLSFQLDTGRRRRPPAHLQGTPADGGAAASPAVPAGGGSGAKPRARASAERGMKRPSPSPASGNLKAGRKAGKAAR